MTSEYESIGNTQNALSNRQEVVTGQGTDIKMEALSICLYCGKKDRSVEFFLPDLYCSQSCADKHGNPKLISRPFYGRPPRRGRKKRASFPNGYDEDFRVNNTEERRVNKSVKLKFNWQKFLLEEKLTAAPLALFTKEPQFPSNNKFSVGMRLEGIDPCHPSKYCVLSVVEVKGHRLRLGFDGYAECYDFWTSANSDEIFPVGWCEKAKKELQIPRGFEDTFNWEKYLQLSKSTAAPHSLFTVCSKEFLAKKPAFQIGDKLEAVDVKNKNTYICVATVADTYGDKILVHFDGWEDNYDYWCYYNSAHIHHVGWCQENLKTLSAPNEYEDPSHFTWESYLEETNSRAAPLDAFEPVTIHEFESGMALEVVDKRNPTLVRVAEIIKVTDRKACIHFCGWDNKYDYWEEVDSPNLHPVAWCQRTGHPLQPPLTPLEIVNYSGPCPTLGCYGYGHVKGAKFTGHHSLCGCPYSDINLNKDNQPFDRLGVGKVEPIRYRFSIISPVATTLSCPLSEVNQNRKDPSLNISQFSTTVRRKRNSSTRGGKTKYLRRGTMESVLSLDSEGKEVKISDVDRENLLYPLETSTSTVIPPKTQTSAQTARQNEIYNSVFLPAASVQRPSPLPQCWDKNIKLLPGVANIQYSDVPSWSAEQVAEFVNTIVPSLSHQQKRLFIDEKIDGTAFLLLNQSDLTSVLKLKLGPAIKIYNGVLVIKKALGRM